MLYEVITLAANMTAGHIILAVLAGFLTLGGLGFGSMVAVKGASAFGFFAITAFEIATPLSTKPWAIKTGAMTPSTTSMVRQTQSYNFV